MSNRPSRSSSIPVRATITSSPARNIESVISMPSSISTGQPRPRVMTQAWSPRTASVGEQRSLGASYVVRRNNTVASSLPTRTGALPLAHSVSSGRGTTAPYPTYEPRVIRADGARNADATCPSSSSVSPRARRPSGAGPSRAPSTQRSSAPYLTTSSEPVPFPRPAYLEHSALRDLLQTEAPSLLPPCGSQTTTRVDSSSSGSRSRRSPSVDSDEEDSSPPRELRKSPPPVVSASLPALLLPTRWCDEYRNALLSVSGDGRDLVYQGTPTTSEKDTATARTIVPVPSACGIYYFEIELTGKASKSRVSIGFVGRDVKLSRLPGWEKNSWGYHGDSGTICSGDRNGTTFGTTFGVGDIIGCGMDFCQNKVFYTKNGSMLGTVFDNVGKDGDVYPSVGLCHTGESIRANFGQDPFKYDIEDHVLQQRNQTWTKIQLAPLKWPNESISHETPEEDVKMSINELVLAYLSHHGYVRTARAFEASCNNRGGLSASLLPVVPVVPSTSTQGRAMEMDMGKDTSVAASSTRRPSNLATTDDIEVRTHIVQSVIAGDIDTALAQTRAHYPLVLEADSGIMLFKLRCRKFVELVLEAAEMKKKMRAEECGMSVEFAHHDDALNGSNTRTFEEGTDMDVDDEMLGMGMDSLANGSRVYPDVRPGTARAAPIPTSSTATSAAATAAQYGAALERAVTYGQQLEADYKHRSEVRTIFKRMTVIMAYYDPLEAGGDAAEVAGQSARVALATELNQAILQSQGHPTQPLLDRLYRQTAVCLTQLALLGNGAAAFADIQKEFLDN
ncbi:hypothetical protein F5J12DRAFT_742896 [Pisolithus orientalis]|uniref:uncharacterized protein n=1 Tax=Pisolithus orientalis TaxID=936130 RepID=UPI002225880E|nr:uncharacterized protein F5J12DRAFT_742896 [Pisolithus orientalis]KAI6005020.1 hypothetical protein F5J12DRAFT_742896 [Pisolithus orientalis]